METVKLVSQVVATLVSVYCVYKSFREAETDNHIPAIYYLMLAMLLLK